MANSKSPIANSQHGVSIYIAVVVTTVALGVAVGISTLLIGELKILQGVGFSVIALGAADGGLERTEYLARASASAGGCGDSPSTTELISCLKGKDISGTLTNGAAYSVRILDSGEDSLCPNYCADSTGEYKGFKRSLRAIR